MTTTVRDAILDILRANGMRRIFGNPGSTEVPFLSGLPDDFHFALARHEGSVIAMAAGYAIATNRPAVALPAAIGFKLGRPARPVIAVLGDGSSMYSIQSLWSAAQESAGVLFLVLANGGYAIMDRLLEHRGGAAVWPSLADISVAAIARGFGVEAERIDTYDVLESVLSAVCPDLAERVAPLLLEVAIRPG